ncbi:endo alpha-1,4 polygalactosaminidase [Plantactinospora sp. CA-290183]|uniref:endo alpha-1,4 polygalactosaminidase n=1 Tax=Plantactinospora sp. CA-290183 TaxID=3240006 RepID=UPI003D89BC8A
MGGTDRRRPRRRPPGRSGDRPGRIRGLALLTVLALALPAATACRPFPIRASAGRPGPTGPAISWQWQLTGPVDVTVDADVFALDGFRTPVEDIYRLRALDRWLVCYVEAGIHHDFRPDAGRFPAAVLGRPTGTNDGRWLDIRQWSALEPILADRFRLCRGKGFTAVLPAGMDGYAHRSGFPLTFDDQLRFNRRLAALARNTGLSPGLTNDLDQALALEPAFDFAVTEDCFRRRQCQRLLPFVEAGKPVFHVEYRAAIADFCTTTRGYGFASIRKDRDLGARRDVCPA